jgi:hypothetical protein
MLAYSALSYCWGDQSIQFPIRCDGQVLEIGRNLYTALNALRDRQTGGPRYFWTDAICINQNNDVEKNHQVLLMTEIYRKAVQVLVWLGEPESEIGPAVLAVQKFANALLTRPGASALTMTNQEWLMLGFTSGEEIRHQIRAFYKLLQRPWFGRVWVIQEYAMAKSVKFLCGAYEVDEAQMMNASAWLASSGADVTMLDWGSNSLFILHGMKAELKAGLKSPTLTLLANFRHRQSTLAVDKIYALHGLASDSGAGSDGLNIQVSYRKREDGEPRSGEPGNVREVYTSLAVGFLCRDRSLEIVTLAGIYTPAMPPELREHLELNLPSWVPDWQVPDSTVSVQWLENKKPRYGTNAGPAPAYMFPFDAEPTEFRACGNTMYVPTFTSNERELVVRGEVIDSISALGPTHRDFKSMPQQWWADQPLDIQMGQILRTMDQMCDWMDLAGAESGGQYFNGESMLDVFWQTMRCGHYPHGYARERQEFMDWLSSLRSLMSLSRSLRSQPLLRPAAIMAHNTYLVSTGASASSTSFIARTNIHTGNRAMFRTNRGIVGMTPDGSRIGDSVAIFEGGSVPFVIRPMGENWVVVGACYVHGCMQGQAFSPGRSKTMVLV